MRKKKTTTKPVSHTVEENYFLNQVCYVVTLKCLCLNVNLWTLQRCHAVVSHQGTWCGEGDGGGGGSCNSLHHKTPIRLV